MSSASTEIRFRFESPKLERALERVCKVLNDAGGRALVVGGCVRDAALGLVSKDLDIEVYGIEATALEGILSEAFAIDLVGKSFGVIKIKGLPIDIAMPRRESKAGLGHRAFEVLSDPFMSVKEAQSRRDFTINAMAIDPLTWEIIDNFSGLDDLDARILRHTSQKFAEDPLRVLRGMQFAARFDFTVAEETVELCRTIDPEGLAPERLYEEWKKLLLDGARPSRGLKFLNSSRWIQYYPELEALVGCPQEPSWHPEGDVWSHTLMSLDAFARERLGDPWEDLVVGFAVLCHDLGKPLTTTQEDEGKLRSFGHEAAGEEPTVKFLERLTRQSDLIEQVVPLVVAHLRPMMLYKDKASDTAVRRLARSVGRIDRLVRVARADQLGRQGVEDSFPAGEWLLERARELKLEREAPKPIVLGRHLIEMGLTPGPDFGPILKACFEAQIDGKFDDLEGGKAFARELIKSC